MAWYPFSNGTKDESGNNYDAINHRARPVSDRFGVSRAALQFDGRQFVDCGENSVFELGEQGTLACWFLSFRQLGHLIGKGPLGIPDAVQLGINPHNRTRGTIALAISSRESDAVHVTKGPPVATRQWYHLVGQWDKSGSRIFLNGKQVAETTGGHRVRSGGHPLLIGKYQTNRYFSGIIDDVAIYDRALNTNEIQALYRYSELADWQEQMSARGLEAVNQLPLTLQSALKGRVSKDESGNLRMQFKGSTVTDLSPLTNLPITELDLDETGIQQIESLAELDLRVLKLWSTRVTNLNPLANMPLKLLFVASKVGDLEPLRDCPLTNIWLMSPNVVDIGALSGINLEHLWIASEKLVDISPLRGAPFEELRLSECPSITDLSPLMECRQLKRLMVHPNLSRQVETLRGHPSLTHILYSYPMNGWHKAKGIEQFWQEYDSRKNPR